MNPLDYFVRKIENELGIQDRGVKIIPNPSREWCTCDTYESDTESKGAVSVKNSLNK